LLLLLLLLLTVSELARPLASDGCLVECAALVLVLDAKHAVGEREKRGLLQ
jgi:hypothetical protein